MILSCDLWGCVEARDAADSLAFVHARTELLDRPAHVLDRSGLDEGDRASAETRACQPGSVAARNPTCRSREQVESRRADLEVLPQADVRVVHQRPEGRDVTSGERVRPGDGAGVLGDDMPGTAAELEG